MNYLYYPGCSLEASAVEYDASTRSMMKALNIRLTDIEGWTCCGATAAESVSHLLSLSLCAINLAKAEAMETGADILVPCSACYLNLTKTIHERQADQRLCSDIDAVLETEDKVLKNPPRVRHLLDVLARDITPSVIAGQVTTPLEDLILAPYYGCQAIRPYGEFDDPEKPETMHRLIQACGAGILDWDMGTQCCGASNMTTKPESAERLVHGILENARGADAIVTVCPMCQLNLEGFQDRLSKKYGTDLSISVLYLPQVIGSALGLPPQDLLLDKNLVLSTGVRQKLSMPGKVRARGV